MSISSYLSPKTRVKESAIEGLGLFAIMPIKKGELIGIKGGHIIDWKTLKKHEDIIDDSFLQIDDNFVLAPLKRDEVEEVMMFLNHSCEPNIGVRGEISFVAIRDIRRGEELTIDYAMIDANRYRMGCVCGKNSCRKKVSGDDWKIEKLQEKYRGYFSRYIQDKIESCGSGKKL